MKKLKEKLRKKKKKGFTLIELLAVIIILGIIMIIAIPSIAEYIDYSRRNSYVATAKGYLDATRIKINSYEYPFGDKDITYWIPVECLSLERGEGKSPYGDFLEGYAVVTYTGTGYNYYFTSRDEAKKGILVTPYNDIDIDSIRTLNSEIQVQLGIGGRPNVGIMDKDSCDADKLKIMEALENIEEGQTATENTGLITDKTAPTIKLDIVKSDLTHSEITITIKDDYSGLSEENKYEYCISSSNTEVKDCEFKGYENEKKFEENSPNRYLWIYPVKDKQGNVSNGYKSIEEPFMIADISTASYEVEPKGWSESKKVVINYPEGYKNEYSLDGGLSWIEYKGEITLTENTTIISRMTSEDKYISGSSQTISQIDRTKPTKVDYTYEINNTNVKITATGEDKESGITHYSFSKDNGESWSEVTTNPVYTYTIGIEEEIQVKVKVYNGTYENDGESNNYLISEGKTIKIPTCVVTFNANGGSISTSNKVVIYDWTYGTLPIPTRIGYTFSGWYTDASGGTLVSETTTVTNEKDHVLYAHWSPAVYTLTYNNNGGTGCTSKSVTYNSSYGTLCNPTRAGYTFLGWYTAASGGTQITQSTTVTSTQNHTIYAHWKINTYTITFNGNGNTGGSTASKTCTIGSACTLTGNGFTKTNYTFAGWSKTPGGSIVYSNGQTVYETSNFTLYAVWVQSVTNLGYTGGAQYFTPTISGNYEIELWGASSGMGGHGAWSGGGCGGGANGGYLKVRIYLTAGHTYTVQVGGAGTGGAGTGGEIGYGGYNGGENGGRPCGVGGAGGGGGGATTFASGATIYASANGAGGGAGGCDGSNGGCAGAGGKGGSGLGTQAKGGETRGFSGDECPNGIIGRCYTCDGGAGEAGSYGYNPGYATFITGSAGARNGNGYATIKFVG